jgi:hypothetical protein
MAGKRSRPLPSRNAKTGRFEKRTGAERSKRNPPTWYVVLYRTGGTARFKWHQVLDRYRTPQAAGKAAAELRRQGYTAFYTTAEAFDNLGLPTTYQIHGYHAGLTGRTSPNPKPRKRSRARTTHERWLTNPPKHKSVRGPSPHRTRQLELAMAGEPESVVVKAMSNIMKERARGATHNKKRAGDLERLAKILEWAARKAADLGL